MKQIVYTVIFGMSVVLAFLSGLACLVVITGDLSSPYTKYYFVITASLLSLGVAGGVISNRVLKRLDQIEEQPPLPF